MSTSAHNSAAPGGRTYLTISEAAEVRDKAGRRRFGSADTIRRRIKNGTIPHRRSGAKYLVPLTALEALERVQRSIDPAAAALADLESAAARLAAVSGPLSEQQWRDLASRLKGVTK